jgi:hypothetical protein
MPNINILKEYNSAFNDIKENFDSSFRVKADDESINKFTSNCEGKYGIETEIESQKDELSKCKKFIYDLTLVLRVLQLKDESKYKEYIQEVEFYISEYNESINKLSLLLDYAG